MRNSIDLTQQTSPNRTILNSARLRQSVHSMLSTLPESNLELDKHEEKTLKPQSVAMTPRFIRKDALISSRQSQSS